MAERGAVHPTQEQPPPAPHMDLFMCRPKELPMHGSVARAPPIGPPAERVQMTGSAAIASRPWAQSRANVPPVAAVRPPILPSAPKLPSPKGPPPRTRWLDPKNPEWA